MRPELPVCPRYIAILAKPVGKIENDGLRKEVELLCERDEGLAGFRLYVSGVHYGQMAACEPLPHDGVQQVEGVARG